MVTIIILISMLAFMLFFRFTFTLFFRFSDNTSPYLFFIGFIFCILAPLLIANLLDKIRKKPDGDTKININEITKNNKYLREKEEQIEKIYDGYYNGVKGYRTKLIVFIAILVLLIVLSIVLRSYVLATVSSVIFLTVITLYLIKYNNITFGKYSTIIKNVLHDYNSDLEYNTETVFNLQEYYTCLFPEACDSLEQDDSIVNKKIDFYYADIKAKYYGHQENASINFMGSLARTTINNTNCRIFLGSTLKKLTYGDEKYHALHFENDDFNRLFHACTDNEVLAYKILTPDVMEQLVNIKYNTYGDIDIRIINDKLYVRFLSGDNFEIHTYNKEKEKQELCQSIATIEEVMNTMENIKKIINNKNIR